MQRALHLHREIPTSSERRAPLAAKGFRPFFLLAAAFAAAVVPLWMLAIVGVFRPGPYLDPTYWHAHEMVFGYSVAVVAGFLLTAVGNWTARETLVGAPLLALAALWALGRVVITGAELFPRWVPAAVDLAFLPALIVVIARPLVAARNKRNLVMVAMLSALLLANLSTHLDALGVLPGWRRRGCLVGVDVVVLMILVMAGRVFPMFTRNATGVASIRSLPKLDALAVGAMALLVVFDVVAPDTALTAVLCAVVGALAAARSLYWGARHSMRVPLLWVLHVGYLWVPLGLGLRAVAALTGAVPASIATHALTVGAMGALTLGMMSRVALGHTGRLLVASKPVVVAFVLVTLAATARVLGPIVAPSLYREAVFLAGTSWSAAFVLFLIVYTPILASARIDGKPG